MCLIQSFVDAFGCHGVEAPTWWLEGCHHRQLSTRRSSLLQILPIQPHTVLTLVLSLAISFLSLPACKPSLLCRSSAISSVLGPSCQQHGRSTSGHGNRQEPWDGEQSEYSFTGCVFCITTGIKNTAEHACEENHRIFGQSGQSPTSARGIGASRCFGIDKGTEKL